MTALRVLRYFVLLAAGHQVERSKSGRPGQPGRPMGGLRAGGPRRPARRPGRAGHTAAAGAGHLRPLRELHGLRPGLGRRVLRHLRERLI